MISIYSLVVESNSLILFCFGLWIGQAAISAVGLLTRSLVDTLPDRGCLRLSLTGAVEMGVVDDGDVAIVEIHDLTWCQLGVSLDVAILDYISLDLLFSVEVKWSGRSRFSAEVNLWATYCPNFCSFMLLFHILLDVFSKSFMSWSSLWGCHSVWSNRLDTAQTSLFCVFLCTVQRLCEIHSLIKGSWYYLLFLSLYSVSSFGIGWT